MKTLIIGAGPLGSLYSYWLHIAAKDITLLARGKHFDFLKNNGLVLVDEFTQEKTVERVNVIDQLHEDDEYDLVIVLMRKNSIQKLLPDLGRHKKFHNILFLGNNMAGFEEYLQHLPKNKIFFGFPGAGGSRIDHVVHYVDREKPNGSRMQTTIGEIDGITKDRTRQVKAFFESSGLQVRIVDDIDSWLKYHVAFILPLAGALLQSGDNYKLGNDQGTIADYIKAVRECGRVLRTHGYRKSYNLKFELFYWLPIWLLTKILRQVFNSKFAEVAMMMHVNAATDEMAELAKELIALQRQSGVPTPYFEKLMLQILPAKVEVGINKGLN